MINAKSIHVVGLNHILVHEPFLYFFPKEKENGSEPPTLAKWPSQPLRSNGPGSDSATPKWQKIKIKLKW
jgi:hypothetical protein